MRRKLFLLVAGLLALVTPAAAKLDLEVAPIRAEHQIPAGVEETNVVEIWNRGNEPVRLRAYLQDWHLERRGALGFSRPGSQPRSLAPWLRLNPTDFQLRPGGRGEIRYTITVPATAAPGTYWTALLIEGQAVQAAPSPRRLALAGRVAVMVYETVGPLAVRGRFEDFQVSQAPGGLRFLLTLSNPGTVFFRPRRSYIVIRGGQGQEVARVEIPDIPVLPGTTQDLSWQQELNLPPGRYQAEALLDIGRRELWQRQVDFKVGRQERQVAGALRRNEKAGALPRAE